MLLEVHDVTKRYGPQKALDGVSVSVPKGQVVGLLGPNGAGKSTLMKSILGYLPTDGGTIAFDGTEVRDGGDAMRRRMGYLPEHNPLYPEMYVREFLDFIAGLHGIKSKAARAAKEKEAQSERQPGEDENHPQTIADAMANAPRQRTDPWHHAASQHSAAAPRVALPW